MHTPRNSLYELRNTTRTGRNNEFPRAIEQFSRIGAHRAAAAHTIALYTRHNSCAALLAISTPRTRKPRAQLARSVRAQKCPSVVSLIRDDYCPLTDSSRHYIPRLSAATSSRARVRRDNSFPPFQRAATPPSGEKQIQPGEGKLPEIKPER